MKIVQSSTVEGISAEKANKINREVPDNLAKFFYINKNNKVSYYRKDAWGSIETWNKGSCNWEYCPAVSDRTLISLPAAAYSPSEVSVQVTGVLTQSQLKQKYGSSFPQLDKELISNRAKELAIKNVQNNISNKVSIDNLMIVPQKYKIDLQKLIEKHNVHKYPTTFVEGENNYAFVYVFEKEAWEVQFRVNYMAGVLTVTSKTCANSVVKELNDLGIKPNQF